MASAVSLIAVGIAPIAKWLFQTEIDRILSSYQQRKKEEFSFILITAFAITFVMASISFNKDLSYSVLQNDLTVDIIFLLLFIGLSTLLILLAACIYIASHTVKKAGRRFIKTIAITTYISNMSSGFIFSFASSRTLKNYSLQEISFFVYLLVIYASMMVAIGYVRDATSEMRLKNQILSINQSEVSEELNRLYLIYALTQEQFILSEQRSVNKSSMSPPFYIYNHTSGTLHKVVENDRGNEMKPRKATHGRKRFFG